MIDVDGLENEIARLEMQVNLMIAQMVDMENAHMKRQGMRAEAYGENMANLKRAIETEKYVDAWNLSNTPYSDL